MITKIRRLFIFFAIIFLFSAFPSSGAEIAASPEGIVTVDAGSMMHLSISLLDTTSGISGYQIEYSTSNTSVISIMNCSFPDWVKLPHVNSSSQSDGFVKGVDLEQKVEPGATPIPLFSLNIVGNNPGSTILILTPKKIEDDLGGRYSIDPLSIQVFVRQNEPVFIQTTSIPPQYSGSSGGSGTGGYSSAGLPFGTDAIQVTPTVLITDNPQPSQHLSLPSTEISEETLRGTTEAAPETTPPVTHAPLFGALSVIGIISTAFLILLLRKII